MADFLYKDEGYKLIVCFYNVYIILGNGFLESVYMEALSKEFDKNQIPYKTEEMIEAFYNEK